jgi:hypothetical protein
MKARASREWFGFGTWNAPYWFIGMNPGGDDGPEIYDSWNHFDSPSLLDHKAHEDDWNARVPISKRVRFFADNPKPQPTWQRLIHFVMGYTNRTLDTRTYQRDWYGSYRGETALLELYAAASKEFDQKAVDIFEAERIQSLHEKLATHRPAFALFYGTTCQTQYEKIVGEAFDRDGFCDRNGTLCILTRHPTAPKYTRSYQPRNSSPPTRPSEPWFSQRT